MNRSRHPVESTRFREGHVKLPPSIELDAEQGFSSSSSPDLTEGQISVALDSDLLLLIDDITKELSRSSVAAPMLPHGGTTAMPPKRSIPWGEAGLDHYVGHESSPPHNHDSFPLRPSSRAKHGHGRLRTASANGPSEMSKFAERAIRSDGKAVQTRLNTSPRNASAASSGSISTARDSWVSPSADPLPQVLHALDKERDDCIVVVRRITRLGFKSNRILKTRLEQFGWDVKNVVLLPSRSRAVDGADSNSSHARPSSMGFVVFKDPASAAECISCGSIDVCGVDVLVQPFTRQYKPSTSASTIHNSS